jgi:hypothetical protein
MRSVPPPPRPDEISLGEAAVGHYRDEVKPNLDLEDAERELTRLLGEGVVQADPPPWASNPHGRPYFLVIADTFALPLIRDPRRGWLATACLVAGQIRPIDRAKRNAAAAQRKSSKRARRRTRLR